MSREEVAKLLDRSVFAQSAIEAELDLFYTQLGLPSHYFLHTKPSTIAKHVEALQVRRPPGCPEAGPQCASLIGGVHTFRPAAATPQCRDRARWRPRGARLHTLHVTRGSVLFCDVAAAVALWRLPAPRSRAHPRTKPHVYPLPTRSELYTASDVS